MKKKKRKLLCKSPFVFLLEPLTVLIEEENHLPLFTRIFDDQTPMSITFSVHDDSEIIPNYTENQKIFTFSYSKMSKRTNYIIFAQNIMSECLQRLIPIDPPSSLT